MQIIESLQEKLYDLEHAGPDVWPGLDVLTQYQAAVRAITSQLQQPELPAYCLRVSAQGRLAGAEPAAGLAQRNSSQGQGANSKQQPQRCVRGMRMSAHVLVLVVPAVRQFS
jgi:hypothetical protein